MATLFALWYCQHSWRTRCGRAPWAGGEPSLALSDAELVLHDRDQFHVRAGTAWPQVARLSLLPAPASLKLDGEELAGTPDGVFMRYSVPMPAAAVPPVALRKLRAAAAPRNVPVRKNGRAREPNSGDWTQAAVWALDVDASAVTSSQARLAMRYRGDTARLYSGDVLLTDNWFSGYRGDGQMEVGLSYLAGKVPGLLAGGANLTLHILPMRQDTLENIVWVRPSLWPDFEGQDSVCELDGVDVIELGAVTLQVDAQVVV